jgi:SAM-dependent methyltransferase
MINFSGVHRGFRRVVGSIRHAIRLLPQYLAIKRASRGGGARFSLRLRDAKPCLADATSTTGFDRHYVFHTAWAARILAKSMPKIHTDISSSLYFIANVSAFIHIKFLDYRPANLGLSGVREEAVDILNLPFADDSIQSLSCMHVVEHIGLGRYGDSIDYDGDIHAAKELKRVLSVGGQLLFVVPVAAEPCIQFNAHRIYSFIQVLSMFEGLVLDDFSLIPDRAEDGGLVPWPSKDLLARQTYACGCFLFRKVNGSV